ncbi:MAG: hypothetical protein UY48_C0006G0045 [Candidatus Gottesmanbacteria bacterium GW2011_GWB1_49_7]|uniref:Uncharacterized protein n=1 Tax=Candidatus Gottesmanbacteria bacterium GW2011_GWB1_49_7 TaxID=1618448 RepID=A0A0G1YDD6_9BACT|nr:MAG: hypothetical protein UY48_C0006G0045 [Candidatus Gottesmanbacteria bacterium GW2011_GWB1_49_7]
MAGITDNHRDILLWEQAKEMARTDGLNEKDGDEFWRLVFHSYKSLHPNHHFKRKAELVAHIFVATNYKA